MGRVVFKLRHLVLAQIAWMLSLPALAAGIGEYQPAAAALDAGAPEEAYMPLDGLPQHLYAPPVPVTLAQTRPNIPTDVPSWRTGIAGVPRTITLFRGDHPDTEFILVNPPEDTAQDMANRWVFTLPGTMARGLYTITVRWEIEGLGVTRDFRYFVHEPPRLVGWKLAGGKPSFQWAGDLICANNQEIFTRNRNPNAFRETGQHILLFSYNDGPVQGRNVRGYASTGCNNAKTLTFPVGSGRTRVQVTMRGQKNELVATINSVLADGIHNYKVNFQHGNADKGGQITRRPWRGYLYYTSPTFDVTYVVSRVSVIMPEVIRPTAPARFGLATVTISREIPNAQWEVEGTPAVAVNLRPVAGARNRQAVVELDVATMVDFESGAEFLTLTVSAVGRESPTRVFHARTRLVIKLSDVREAPVFREPLATQGIVRGSGSNTFQLPAAFDPSGNGVTYSAAEDGENSLPTGITFDAGTRTFTVASNAALGEYRIRVRTQDRSIVANLNEEVFLLLVRDMAGILVFADNLDFLSRANPAGAFMVQLDLQPASKDVTLTLKSLVADMSVSPLTLEFTPTNWNIPQPVEVELTDTGLGNKGTREITVSLGVYSQSSSDSGYRASLPVSVTVQVDNPNARPMFVAGAHSPRQLPENEGKDRTATNTPVGAAIAATDADNPPGELTYSLVGSSSVFKIVPASGQLQVAVPTNFNFEKVPRYLVTVQVQDNEGALRQMARITVSISVQDINERPGNYSSHAFGVAGKTRGQITVTWNNDEYSGSSVGQFDAEDLSSIVVSYGTSGFADALSLAPDATRATIVNLASGTAYDITLRWYSADNLGNVTPVTIVVSTNANAVPAFTGSLFYTRPENAGAEKTAAGTAVATVAATDANMGDIVNYSIRTGADSALLAIGEANGVMRLSREVNLNHEVRDTYTVTVQAEDNFGGFATRAATVSITGINEAPEFPEQKSVQTATAGTESTITLTAATDPENDGLQYQASLGSGADLPDWLRLDSATGQFTVDSAAAAGLYQIRAKAVETGNSPNLESAERSFTLVVVASGSTNNLPTVGNATVTLSENTGDATTAAGTLLTQIIANDVDFADILVYSLDGADAALFAIDRLSGVLTLKEKTAFDHEGQDLYVFMVVVDDQKGGLASAEFVVEVSDVNEAPEIAPIATQLVIKGVEKTLQLEAAEDPEGDNLVYTATLPGDWLRFMAATREFEVSAEAPLGNHVVTLTATETGRSPNLRSERPFVIRIQSSDNVNRSPVFPDRIRLELPENTGSSATAAGSTVGVVMAEDADNDSLAYAISGADAAPFGIDPASGTITVATETAFDREFKDSYVFAVTADDGNGGVALGEVIVTISDVNEPPVLAQLPVQQLTRGAITMFTVPAAVDPEGKINLTYTATVPGIWLTFTAATREFAVAADAPLGDHVVTLAVTETGNSPNLSVEMIFTIRIQAAPGENPPPVFSGSTTFDLQESAGDETPAGTLVGVVTARDEEGKVEYSIAPGADAEPFGIDAVGQIQVTVATRFDADVKAAYTIQVLASDGNSAGSAQVVVRIIPIVRVSDEDKDHLSINAIDRAIAIAVVDIIATRLDSAIRSGSGGGISRPEVQSAGEGLEEDSLYMRMRPIDDQWSDWREDEHEGAEARFVRTDWEEFLYSRGFDLAMSPPEGHQSGPQSRLWGLGSRLSLDGRPTIDGVVVPYEGDASVLMIGGESYLGEVKVGMAAGQSKVEFTVGEERAQVERILHSAHPYVNWQPFERTQAWLSAGLGTGDYIRKEGGKDPLIREAEYMSITGGLRRQWQFGNFELGMGGKVMKGKSVLLRTAALEESKSDDWRMEVDFRVGLPVEIPDSRFGTHSFLGGNLRRDGGGGFKTNEMDVEVGTRLDWEGGFSAGISGRWQITTKRETNERRITGSFSYDAGSDGQGLMVSMEPSFDAKHSEDGVLQHRAMRASVGYGLPLRLFANSGMVLLNAQVDYAGVEAARAYGFSFAGRRLQIDLSAEGSTYNLHLRLK